MSIFPEYSKAGTMTAESGSNDRESEVWIDQRWRLAGSWTTQAAA